MTRYALFLRGINVGGVRVPMPQLRTMLERLGATNVQTWLNTGNVALDDARDAQSLKRACEAALTEEFGYEAYVLVRPLADLVDIVAAYPFSPHPDMHRYVVFGGAVAEAEAVEALRKCLGTAGAAEETSGSVGLARTKAESNASEGRPTQATDTSGAAGAPTGPSGSAGLALTAAASKASEGRPTQATDTSEAAGAPTGPSGHVETVAALGTDLMWLCPKGSTTSSVVGKILARKDLKPLVTTRNLNTVEKLL